MKILFLTHTFPYPLNDGVRLHIFHILKEIAKKHSVFLLSLNDVPVSEEEKKEVQRLGVGFIKVLSHSVTQNFAARLFNTLLDPVPFCVRQFELDSMKKELRKFLLSEKIDVVHVDYISMAVYRPEFSFVPALFFPHDAVSMLFERNIGCETNLFRKIYTFLQWKKIKNFESFWMPKFQETMVVSPVDKEYLMRHCPGAHIGVSANGVDTEYFAPRNGMEENHSILFRGVMNFFPNSDAVRFFYKEVYPTIVKEVPDLKFYIVGKSPPSDLLDAARKDPHLVFTGYVADMREWMARASVIVSPMRIGSGIKNKILEPMAMAKAIVCTPLSCAGIQARHGEHLFMEENAASFAERVVALLKDPSLRKEVGQRAQVFVKSCHTWKRNVDAFEELYVKAVKEFQKK